MSKNECSEGCNCATNKEVEKSMSEHECSENCNCENKKEEATKTIKVEILGPGCSSCQQLYKDIQEVITELGIAAEVEKIEDLQKIMAYGIMTVPALVVDGELKFAGRTPDKEELMRYLLEDSGDHETCTCGCDCGCGNDCDC